MPKFMVQVILHDTEATSVYDRLNAAMAKQGFARELVGRKGSYHLPAGSYWYVGDSSSNDLRLLAAAAAETTGQSCGIVVVRANGWSIMRLRKVEAAPQG